MLTEIEMEHWTMKILKAYLENVPVDYNGVSMQDRELLQIAEKVLPEAYQKHLKSKDGFVPSEELEKIVDRFMGDLDMTKEQP